MIDNMARTWPYLEESVLHDVVAVLAAKLSPLVCLVLDCWFAIVDNQ